MPVLVVELLRLCVVVFAAALGYEVAHALGGDARLLGGAVSPTSAGVALGAAVGYVAGGAVGRLTARSVARAEEQLRQRSAEQLLAGAAGAVAGVVVATGTTWPLLLLGPSALVLPVFCFVVLAIGTLGYHLGLARRDGVLALLGPRAGLAAAPAPATALPRLLDSSVAVDGRLLDVVRAGFLHGELLVLQPVLDELQGLADAGDDVRRAKGRRGLQLLEALRRERSVEVVVLPDECPEVPEVDAKLVRTSLDRGVPLLTLDTALARAASLAGCRVMNLHALALALRPPVVAGDTATVLLLKPGREPGQAVGYLDDGTMVVVERARERVGGEAAVAVTSVLTTANGRMVFARLADGAAA